MSMWDNLLPHRFLINRSLRKASDELRDRIDSYRIEHEMAVQRCHDEIEADKKEKDRQFELRKQEYLKDLTQVSGALGELQTLFLDYVDLYMKMKHLYFIKDKMKLELQLLNEYSNFLTEQMKLIGEEIGILEQRQESLSLQVKIDDIVALISLTGADLPCDASDNPKTLVKLAICLSLRSDIPLSEKDMATNTLGRELNRQTITGDADVLYKCLIELNLNRHITDEEFFPLYVKAHLDRGMQMLDLEQKYGGDFLSHLVELEKAI